MFLWTCETSRSVRHRGRIRVPLQPLEVSPQLGGRLTANVAILLQRLVDDLFQLRRGVGVYSKWRYRCSIQNGFEDHTASVASKRQGARAHLVQHRPERKQVSTSIEFLPSNLLRRHESDCAYC